MRLPPGSQLKPGMGKRLRQAFRPEPTFVTHRRAEKDDLAAPGLLEHRRCDNRGRKRAAAHENIDVAAGRQQFRQRLRKQDGVEEIAAAVGSGGRYRKAAVKPAKTLNPGAGSKYRPLPSSTITDPA